MQLLKGAEVSAAIKKEVQESLKALARTPVLAIVRLGDNPDDLAYEKGAVKKMEAFGLAAEIHAFSKEIEAEEFKRRFSQINGNPNVAGILLLKPLPPQIGEEEIAAIIDPLKDVDGIAPVNMARVYEGDSRGFAPCTAEAVMEILHYYQIPTEGKTVAVVGRSMVVGKPLAMLLLKDNATVTVCHTRTRDLSKVCKKAEILIAAAGRAHMITPDYIGENAVVIDVGINVGADGKLCGDVDLEGAEGTASMGTPVPGGVGAVTTAVLARHLVLAAQKQDSFNS